MTLTVGEQYAALQAQAARYLDLPDVADAQLRRGYKRDDRGRFSSGGGGGGGGIGSMKGRQARLEEMTRQTETGRQTLSGGAMGSTEMVTVSPGVGGTTRYIEKSYDSKHDGLDQTHAEIVQASVMDAVGAPAAAVVQTGPTRIAMEMIPGRDAQYYLGPEATQLGIPPGDRHLLESEAGMRMAIGDYIMGQTDRKPANMRITPDGTPVAIDGGFAFQATDPRQALLNGPARVHLMDESNFPFLRDQIDIPRSEVAAMRPRLEALRPQFDALGRGDWHDTMMLRLDDIESRARP